MDAGEKKMDVEDLHLSAPGDQQQQCGEENEKNTNTNQTLTTQSSSSSSSSGGGGGSKSVKCVYEGADGEPDIRRFKLSTPTFSNLCKFLRDSYQIRNLGEGNGKRDFVLKYVDDEDEKVTISSDIDLREAFRVAEAQKKKCLKIFVTKKMEKMVKDHTHTQAPTTHSGAKGEHETKNEMKNGPITDNDRGESKLEYPPSMEQIKAHLLTLFQDSRIVALLPSIYQSVLNGLQNNESVQTIIDGVLATYDAVRSHTSVKALIPWLPNYIGLLDEYRKKLLANPQWFALATLFGPQIAARIPEWFQMMDGGNFPNFFDSPHLFGGEREGGREGGTDRGTATGFSTMNQTSSPGFQSQSQISQSWAPGTERSFVSENPWKKNSFTSSSSSSSQQQQQGQAGVGPIFPQQQQQQQSQYGASVVHYGVICDACDANPIRGVRYKCSICPNFDLCEKCEKAKIKLPNHRHLPSHPLIKIKVPGSLGQRGAGGGGRKHHPFYRREGGGRPKRHHNYHHHRHGGHGQWRDRAPHTNVSRPLMNKAKIIKGSLLDWKDEKEFLPNGVVIKSWTVTNTGKLPWPKGTQLLFFAGNLRPSDNEKAFMVPVCQPGKTVKLTVVLTAPAEIGRYKAKYRLAIGDGTGLGDFFGPKLKVHFSVKKQLIIQSRPISSSSSNVLSSVANSDLTRLPSAPPEPKAGHADQLGGEKGHFDQKNREPDTYQHQQKQGEGAGAGADTEKQEKGKETTEEDNVKKYAKELNDLAKMGFCNREINLFWLVKKNGNVQDVCNWIIENKEFYHADLH